MDDVALNILKFLAFSQKLKSQQRAIKLSEDRNESSADHSWHLALMAIIVAPYLKQKVDLLNVLKMSLIHDLVEAEIGDTFHGDSVTKPEVRGEKKRKETEEMERIRKMIDGDVGEEIANLWNEYERLETMEAKFVKALDSLEANHQSIMYDVGYWEDYYYPIALTKADKYCEHEEILKALNKVITKQMREEFERAEISLK